MNIFKHLGDEISHRNKKSLKKEEINIKQKNSSKITKRSTREVKIDEMNYTPSVLNKKETRAMNARN